MIGSQIGFCLLICVVYIFPASQDCDSPLGEQSRSFPHTLPSWGAENVDGRQDLWTGDSTEYRKLVIILILLHLIACSFLVGWQLLSLDRVEKKKLHNGGAIDGSCCVNRTNRAESSTSTCSRPEHQLHSYNYSARWKNIHATIKWTIRFSFFYVNIIYYMIRCQKWVYIKWHYFFLPGKHNYMLTQPTKHYMVNQHHNKTTFFSLTNNPLTYIFLWSPPSSVISNILFLQSGNT